MLSGLDYFTLPSIILLSHGLLPCVKCHCNLSCRHSSYLDELLELRETDLEGDRERDLDLDRDEEDDLEEAPGDLFLDSLMLNSRVSAGDDGVLVGVTRHSGAKRNG